MRTKADKLDPSTMEIKQSTVRICSHCGREEVVPEFKRFASYSIKLKVTTVSADKTKGSEDYVFDDLCTKCIDYLSTWIHRPQELFSKNSNEE